MYKSISRREFLKVSAYTIAVLCSQMRLPVFAANKSFTPFKFAFVPDVHFSTYRFDDWILLNESLIILQDTIKTLEDSDVDFILFGGDLIDNEQKDFADLPTLLDLLYVIEKPYYVIFGDREARLNNSLCKEDFTAEFRRNGFLQRGRTYWAEQVMSGVDLIGLDSTIINKMQGEVSPSQLVWLSNTLRQNPNNFKIITLHHPLLPENIGDDFYDFDGFRLNNSSALFDVIDRCGNVDLVLSGHHHVNKIESKNNVHYINSPSITTYPCEYRVFEVNNNYIDIKNYRINFKQMIKKAEDNLLHSRYIERFPDIKPKKIVKMHKGNKSDRNQKIKI